MKKIIILICVFMLAALIGCERMTVDTDKEGIFKSANTNETISQEQTKRTTDDTDSIQEEDSTDNDYEWIKLEQYARMRSGSGSSSNGSYYDREDYFFAPLCEDPNITSIEYYLENGTGTFMDKNRTSGFGDNVTSEPYLLEGDNQEGIYFTAYFQFVNEKEMPHKDKVKIAAKVLEKMHIRLTITYQDGSVKVRNIGLRLMSQSNYYNLDMYELILKE